MADIDIGSPEWWRKYLIRELMTSQERFAILDDYASGNHPLPTADQRYFKALREIQRKARSNYYGMVTKAPIERMRVKGFRFGKNGAADDDAKLVWAYNDMDYQNQYLLRFGAVFGRTYLLVNPPEDGQKYPTMTYEDPRMCITFQDPVKPTRSLAGLKLWSDIPEGIIKAVLWTPEKIYHYDGPKITTIEGYPVHKQRDVLHSSEGIFELVRVEDNPLGDVPLVYIEWQAEGLAEAEDLLDVQDRINLTLLHRLVITQNQSFRQRWMSGVAPKRGKKGSGKPQFDPGADMLWVTDNPDAKFGDFAQADITQVLEAVRDDISDMASLSKTPIHYLMGKLANVSGDTLTQGESGFVSKIKLRMASVGWGLERAMRLAFKYMNQTEKAEEVDAEVLWADPEVRTRAETADAAVKEAQVLATAPPYALALIMGRMGWDPDEIRFAMEEREKWEAEQQAREDKLMEKEQSGQENLAKMAAQGRQGSGGTAQKKTNPSGKG